MATKAKAKRTAKAKETKAEKVDAAELREVREMAAAVFAYGGEGGELDRVAAAWEDATDAANAFAGIVRNGGPGDIRRAFDGFLSDPDMGLRKGRVAGNRVPLRYDTHFAGFVENALLLDGYYQSEYKHGSMRLRLAVRGFDQACFSMFDAVCDRFADRAGVFDELRRRLENLMLGLSRHDWHEAADAEQARRVQGEYFEQARVLLDDFRREMIAAEGAGGRSANGPRMPRGNEAKILQMVYILHNACKPNASGKNEMNWQVARSILDFETLDDSTGVRVWMVGKSGEKLGYVACNTEGAFRTFVRRARDNEEVARMVREFKDRGRSLDLVI